MNRFSQIEAFVIVADLHSFTAASEKLDVAKSLLSRRISQLEQRLGAQLMQRTTRKLSLTEAGRLFYQRAVILLADLYEAEQLVSDQQCSLSGPIRLAAPLSFGLLHLANPIAQFMQQHEQIEIEMDLNDREIDLVEEGFDIAIRIGKLPDSSLIARKLGVIRFLTCASKDYLKRHGEPLYPEQLSDHNLLLYSNISPARSWKFMVKDQLFTPKIHSRIRANNGDILAKLTVEGLGISHAPSFILSRYVKNGQLVRLLKDFPSPEVGMFALYPPGRLKTRRVKLLSDFLAQQFGENPYWDD